MWLEFLFTKLILGKFHLQTETQVLGNRIPVPVVPCLGFYKFNFRALGVGGRLKNDLEAKTDTAGDGKRS